MIVRKARFSDRKALLRLGRAMRAESLIRFPEISPPRVWWMIACARYLPRWCYFSLVEDGGRVVGFLTGFRAGFTYCNGHVALHDIWFVAPSHRGTSAARRLIKDFEAWGNKIGASGIVVGIHTGLNTGRSGAFLERLGFRHMGGEYWKDASV